ncbi:hypothetical protein ONS96_003831 [Cadophora gregata f. sp. sojae]|nr:hypothetical protein ONS96_003831 [Cadophora gregata f. sp. sojae]
MAYSTSSTTAIDGSADEFAPSPTTAPPPRTQAKIAAEAALSRQRTSIFIADTSLPVVTPRTYYQSSTVVRTQAAAAQIQAFDAAFNKVNNDNSDSGNVNTGKK